MEIGHRLKEVRQSKNLTQKELGERLNVSDKTISSWETGRTYPDIFMILKLYDHFDVSLDELVKGDVEKMRNMRDSYRYKEVNYLTNFILLFGLFFMIVGRKSFGDIFSVLMGISIIGVIAVKRVILRKIEDKHGLYYGLISLKTADEVIFMLENPGEDISQQNKGKLMKKVGKYLLVVCLFLVYIFLCSLVSKHV